MPRGADKNNIQRLVSVYGEENRDTITQLYEAQLRLLESQNVLSQIAYRATDEICKVQFGNRARHTESTKAGKPTNFKVNLFYELGNLLFPDYLSRANPRAIAAYVSPVTVAELRKAVDTAKIFLSENPEKRIKDPKGTRPSYTSITLGEFSQRIDGNEFRKRLAAHIKENTGIELPLPTGSAYYGIPAKVYEEIAVSLGL